MDELKCPCGLREYMDEEDCRKTLCCECCPLQKEDTDVPAADVVEVVRCKNCKYAVWDEEEQIWKCVISADWDEDIGEYVGFVEYHDADDFCSAGERKDPNV